MTGGKKAGAEFRAPRLAPERLWVWLNVEGRAANLLCVVLVLEQVVIVKTAMHHSEMLP